MTLYEQMTNTINVFTTATIEQEKIFNQTMFGSRGMIEGAEYVRDNMTIEAASIEV